MIYNLAAAVCLLLSVYNISHVDSSTTSEQDSELNIFDGRCLFPPTQEETRSLSAWLIRWKKSTSNRTFIDVDCIVTKEMPKSHDIVNVFARRTFHTLRSSNLCQPSALAFSRHEFSKIAGHSALISYDANRMLAVILYKCKIYTEAAGIFRDLYINGFLEAEAMMLRSLTGAISTGVEKNSEGERQ